MIVWIVSNQSSGSATIQPVTEATLHHTGGHFDSKSSGTAQL